MIYRGQFGTKDDKTITVEIWTGASYGNYSGQTVVTIGENGLFFGENPVVITRDLNDSFDHIIIHQAEIQLKTENYIGDKLTSLSSDDIWVRIFDGDVDSGTLLFFGHAEPLVFSQPYVTRLDEFTITATDRLGQLQYFNYQNIYTKTDYNNYLKSVSYKSFYELFEHAFSFMADADNLWYDMSIGLTSGSASTSNIFNDLSVSDAVIIGEDIDDVMTLNEVLEHLLKYLNLHLMCIGSDFYVFNWYAIRERQTSWYNIFTHETKTIAAPYVTFSTSMHADADANLTMDAIYTQISAKADIEGIDDTISSPLDSDSLMSFYNKQKYMTELISYGEGDDANNAFECLLNGTNTDYDACKTVDWYCHHKYNKNWTTYILDSSDNIRKDINSFVRYSRSLGQYINQHEVWQALHNNPCSAGIFEFGHIENQVGRITDNAPVHKLEMTPYLCFSLNGNHDHTQDGHLPNETQLTNAAPICEFNSPFNGGVYSPTSDGVTNYLVFSGKFFLQKPQKETGSYYTIGFGNYKKTNYKYMCCPAPDGEMYYTRKWWGQAMPTTSLYTTSAVSFHPPKYEIVEKAGGNYNFPYDNENPDLTYTEDLYNWMKAKEGWSDGGDLEYEYNFSREGNNNDLYYKLPLLECELIIGNKRLIEYNWGRKDGEPSTVKPDYRWVTVGEEPQIVIRDPNGNAQTVTLTTFSLGIDPKIGDFIVGKEHEMANNVEFTMGIDADGTAIPITAEDGLAGDVTFRIIGPITTIWNEIEEHSHSWWLLWAHHYYTWTSELKYIFSECETMFVKDFQCKLYSSESSDNRDTSGKEIIYMSVEDSKLEKKDDISFKFCTQPSMETFIQNNVPYQSCKNAVLRTSDNLPVTELYMPFELGSNIPEMKYVFQYYEEYHHGKLLLQGTYHVNEFTDWTKIYKLPSIDNKEFYIQKISHSLRQNEADVTFKEI